MLDDLYTALEAEIKARFPEWSGDVRDLDEVERFLSERESQTITVA